MWNESLSADAKNALTLAREEARRLGHDYISTTHLFLGLTEDGSSLASKILRSLGVNLADVRAEARRLAGHRAESLSREAEIGPALIVGTVMQDALREALAMRHSSISSQHILWGLIRADNLMIGRLLDENGASVIRIADLALELAPLYQAADRDPQYFKEIAQKGPGNLAFDEHFRSLETAVTDSRNKVEQLTARESEAQSMRSSLRQQLAKLDLELKHLPEGILTAKKKHLESYAALTEFLSLRNAATTEAQQPAQVDQPSSAAKPEKPKPARKRQANRTKPTPGKQPDKAKTTREKRQANTTEKKRKK